MAAANCICVVLESMVYRLLMQSVTMDLCMLGHAQICNEFLAEGTQLQPTALLVWFVSGLLLVLVYGCAVQKLSAGNGL